MLGDLVFVKPTNAIGKLVAFLGGSGYSHVGILMEDNQIAEINLGKPFSVYPMRYTEYDVYRVNQTFDQAVLKSIINSKIGMKYDTLDLLRILFRLTIRATPNKVICSEVVNQCFEQLGIQLSRHKIPTPQDLIEGGKLERVEYNGFGGIKNT